MGKLTITLTHCDGRGTDSFSPTQEQLKEVSAALNDFGLQSTLTIIPIRFEDLYALYARERFGKESRFWQDGSNPDGFGRILEAQPGGSSSLRTGHIFFSVEYDGKPVETQGELESALRDMGLWPERKKHAGGRKPKAEHEKATGKSISLTVSEWAALAARDPDGLPTREAVRIIRQQLNAALKTN